MKKITAKTKLRNYPVIIKKGIILGKNSMAAELVKNLFPDSSRIVLATDDKVLSLYRDIIDIFLTESGKEYRIITVPEGERSKSLASTEKIYKKLLDFNMHRNDLMIAFGGGVIGDLGGFAASTFHRGIKLLQFPTTVISQVDSSIGGKVVVNLDSYKNIIGSFYQPHAVIIDPSFLKTLEEKEILNGISEVLKYGIVFDKKIIEKLKIILEKLDRVNENKCFGLVEDKEFEEIIYRCCRIKTEIVCRDEFDTGLRNLLNFGHTFGHALEKTSGLKGISHGEAVAIGIMLSMDLSIKLKLLKPELKKEILGLYKILKLPYKLSADDPEVLIDAIKFDKKFTAKRNKFILLKGLNKPVFYYDVDEKTIMQSIEENLYLK